MIFPTSLKMMPREKKQVVSGSVGIVFRVIMTALIVYVDYLLVWIMGVINRNSRIEYHQTGEGRHACNGRLFIVTAGYIYIYIS